MVCTTWEAEVHYLVNYRLKKIIICVLYRNYEGENGCSVDDGNDSNKVGAVDA